MHRAGHSNILRVFSSALGEACCAVRQTMMSAVLEFPLFKVVPFSLQFLLIVGSCSASSLLLLLYSVPLIGRVGLSLF